MRKLFLFALVLAGVAAGLGWYLTAPNRLSAAQVAKLPLGEAPAGEQIFWAGGCTSCHAAPGSKGDDKRILAGGLEMNTPFGVFRVPNISPHPQAGIGNWSLADFANAMKRGVRPDGAHYFPAFPYTSYIGMTDQDVSDLWAYLLTLPQSENSVGEHDIAFPFSVRRGLGLWKMLYLDQIARLQTPEDDEKLQRGRYLVEVLGHCGECHTPRNMIGGMKKERWLAGGVSPEGKGKIPNITPHRDGIGDWSLGEIADSLKTGFTPEFDSFGSSMADVQQNTAKLSDADRAAIAAYLKAVEPVAGRP